MDLPGDHYSQFSLRMRVQGKYDPLRNQLASIVLHNYYIHAYTRADDDTTLPGGSQAADELEGIQISYQLLYEVETMHYRSPPK